MRYGITDIKHSHATSEFLFISIYLMKKYMSYNLKHRVNLFINCFLRKWVAWLNFLLMVMATPVLPTAFTGLFETTMQGGLF